MPTPTNVPTQTPLGPYPAGGVVAALALDIAWQAADVSNGNSFKLSGRELLLVWNTDVSGRTFTLTSVSDARGRTDDVTSYAIAAATVSAFNFRAGGEGWQQGDGTIKISANNALVKFAVLTIN